MLRFYRTRHTIILLAVLLFVCKLINAQPINLDNTQIRVISSNFSFLEDKSEVLNIVDITQKGIYNQFRPVDTTLWNDHNQVYWLSFSLKNSTHFDEEWILDFENWAFVDFYTQADTNYREQKTGYLYPFRKRDYPYANKCYIKLALKAGEQKKCFVRIERSLDVEKIPQSLNFSIGPRHIFDDKDAHSGQILFTFIGVFLVMLIYNSFIFISTQLKSYAYYLLVLFFALLFTAGNSGFIIQFFSSIDSFPVWYSRFDMSSSNLMGIVYTLFVQNFLKVKIRYPVWNKFLNALIVAYIISGVLTYIYFDFGFNASALLGFMTFPCIIYIGIRSIRDGYPSSLFFSIGFLCMFLGILCVILSLVGLFPKNDFTLFYALPTGSALEVILLAFALANMINVLRRENEEKQRRIIHQFEENQQLQTTLNRKLEQKVQERTLELNQSLVQLRSTQDQLIMREKMASLGELTAGVAHEIQNPLNFVNNFSEISTELVDEVQQEITEGNLIEVNSILHNLKSNLNKILAHGRRADAIVKGMLEHSRTGSGERRPINLNTLADEYLKMSYKASRSTDSTLHVDLLTDFNPTLGLIEVVPQEIGQVLLNLYHNAFYAVSEKAKLQGKDYKPQIFVSTQIYPNKVKLLIKDNGIGIPSELLSKIYQPFFTTKPTGKGTGLGLFLAYDIITKGHGGELTVTTEKNLFTEFSISLPYTPPVSI